MFETMDALNKLLAEKDQEVEALKKAHRKVERELAEMASFNLDLQERVRSSTAKVQKMQAEMVEQQEGFEEMVSNVTVKSVE